MRADTGFRSPPQAGWDAWRTGVNALTRPLRGPSCVLLLLVSCVDFPARLPEPLDCMDDGVNCIPPGMVLVPAGGFVMGSNIENDELPTRRVHVDLFFIDETEVTVMDYAVCVESESCGSPDAGAGCNWSVDGRGEYPINCVTWFQAQEYCRWAGDGMKRLPTEAEWEKAARGTDARKYPWGDLEEPACDRAVVEDASQGGAGCGTGGTMAVGTKPAGASPYGVQDMVGNVGEWVADWYGDSYGGLNGRDPEGPIEGVLRVWRGGSWALSPVVEDHEASSFRSAKRESADPDSRSPELGFRCVRTTPVVQE